MPKNIYDKSVIIKIDEDSIKNKIYEIRGQKVMLDFDLARIYGYTTKDFNRQVKNNIEKFDDDFMIQLTETEFNNLRCKNFTSSWGGARYLPYAFTEQGIYMLMTVLKGELATKQSKTLIRTFRAMKDYILENRALGSYQQEIKMLAQVAGNTKDIMEMKNDVENMKKELMEVEDKIGDMVTKSELSPLVFIL